MTHDFDDRVRCEKEWLHDIFDKYLKPLNVPRSVESEAASSDWYAIRNENRTDRTTSLHDDAIAFSSHLRDKAELRILQPLETKEREPPYEAAAVESLLSFADMDWRPNWLHDVPAKRRFDLNLANETLRERTSHCLCAVGEMLCEEVVAALALSLCEEVVALFRGGYGLFSRGVLRGVLSLNDGNRRFVQSSGKLRVVRGVLDDLAKQRKHSLGAHRDRVFEQVQQMHVRSARALLDALYLEVKKEERNLWQHLQQAFRSTKKKKNSTKPANKSVYTKTKEEILAARKKEQAQIEEEQARESLPITWLHTTGCIDMPALEKKREREKQHVQSMRMLRVEKMTLSVLDHKLGHITASLFVPERESKSSLWVIGTSLGRLLCVRIHWTNSRAVELLGSNRESKSVDKCTIVDVRASPTGAAHVITINAAQRVAVWSLHALLNPPPQSSALSAHSTLFSLSTCFPWRWNNKDKPQVFIEKLGIIDENELQYRFRVDPRDLTLHPFAEEIERELQPKKKTNKTLVMKVYDALQSKPDLEEEREASCIAFFGAINERRQATSLLVGSSDGEIFKFNLDVTLKNFRAPLRHPVTPFVVDEFVNPLQAPENFILVPRRETDKAQGSPRSTTLHVGGGGGNKVFRELFHGHRSAVEVIETTDSASCSFLSVDAAGEVLEWRYDEDHLAGTVWFVPHQRRHISLDFCLWEVSEDDRDSAASLDEFFGDDAEKNVFRSSLQVSRIFYREIPATNDINNDSDTNRKTSVSPRKRNSTIVASNDNNNVDAIPTELQSSPLTRTSPRGARPSMRTPPTIIVGRKEEPDRRRFEITRVYHAMRDEDSDETVQYEETVTLTFSPMRTTEHAAAVDDKNAESKHVFLHGVKHVVEERVSRWTRAVVHEVQQRDGAFLLLVGRKMSCDGAELILIYRRCRSPSSDDENADTTRQRPRNTKKNEQSALTDNYVAACLNAETMTFRHPLTLFSLDDQEREVIIDFACGPVAMETRSRLLFLLTSQGVRTFGLHTGQEVFIGANPLPSNRSAEEHIVRDVRHCAQSLPFSPTKIAICPSQRVMLLFCEKELCFELFLLAHDLDGASVNEEKQHQNNETRADNEATSLELPDPWSELFAVDGSPSDMCSPPGEMSESALLRCLQSTIIDQKVSRIDPEAQEAVLSTLEEIVIRVEDIIDSKLVESHRRSLVHDVLGDNLGFIPPTTWPPSPS